MYLIWEFFEETLNLTVSRRTAGLETAGSVRNRVETSLGRVVLEGDVTSVDTREERLQTSIF